MAKQPFVENYILPEQYDTTSITLIARDPYWIYAYWNISETSLNHLRLSLGSDQFQKTRYVLKMNEVSLITFNGYNANHSFDIDVGAQTRDWYVNLSADHTTYVADLGLLTDTGTFFLLARSNCVTTQRAGLSGRTDSVWMKIDQNEPNKAIFYSDDVVSNPPQPANAEQIFQDKPLIKQIEYKEIAGRSLTLAQMRKMRLRLTLSEDDIREYYSRMFPLLCRVKLNRKKRQGRWGLSDSELDALYALDPAAYRWDTDSSMRRKIFIDKAREKLFIGASDELERENKTGGSEQRGDLVNPIASQELVAKSGERKFFFEIGTELIVYGRTEADATVTLGGKKIELRPDGTFTLRFALPEGKIPLDFVAHSSNKINQRTIATNVERSKTKYGS